MNEAFNAYWQTRLEEQPELDDADKTEAQMAFEAAYLYQDTPDITVPLSPPSINKIIADSIEGKTGTKLPEDIVKCLASMITIPPWVSISEMPIEYDIGKCKNCDKP